MLLFELDAPLFALKANAPAFEPLSQFPDYKSFARWRAAYFLLLRCAARAL
jgi:hypothetical protein